MHRFGASVRTTARSEGHRDSSRIPPEHIGFLDTDAGPIERTCGRSRVIAVTSGKGGVGKTSVVVNTAYALAERGERVLVLDADFGLGNVDILFGLTPEHTLQHVIYGQKHLPEIVMQGPLGIRLIPASSGMESLASLNPGQKVRLFEQMMDLQSEADVLLIDTASGISPNVIHLVNAAEGAIVVCSPEPSSIVDAYAMIKIILSHHPGKNVQLLVNGTDDYVVAEEIHDHLCQAAEQATGQMIGLLGMIPKDANVSDAVMGQLPVGAMFPDSSISESFRGLASRMLKAFPDSESSEAAGEPENFWQRLRRIHEQAGDAGHGATYGEATLIG